MLFDRLLGAEDGQEEEKQTAGGLGYCSCNKSSHEAMRVGVKHFYFLFSLVRLHAPYAPQISIMSFHFSDSTEI